MRKTPIHTPDSRRSFIQKAALSSAAAGAMLGGFGFDPFIASAMAQEMGRSEKPLKAAFSNAGLQATWCAQGKQAAEFWGKDRKSTRLNSSHPHSSRMPSSA